MTEQVIVSQIQATPQPGQWTYADYLALPDDGRRYEIIEGVLYVANAPNAAHQFAVTELSRQMGNFVMDQKLGRVLVAPFEVHLAETSRPVMPDVLFVHSERWPKESIQFFAGAPDLVVEVVSPSSTRVDRVVKFTTYEQAGVPEYWIVNPHTKSVEVYTLSNQEYALFGDYTGDEIIHSQVLAGLTIVASTLFA
ncbi:MAG: Uma2 family endonuclease [Caldilineaceae bacterium]